MSTNFAQKSTQARHATLLLLVWLILTLLLETVMLAPAATGLGAMLLVMAAKTLPLLFFLQPIYRARALSGIWLSLLLMPYLCMAVLQSFATGWTGIFGLLQSGLLTACCIAALLLTRWQKKLADTQSTAP
ncbi:MAG: DUF2069 domain-containing protein [Moraxellaceae bacterium]